MKEREFDAFTETADRRIYALDMHVEQANPPFHVREEWARDAKYDPPPPHLIDHPMPIRFSPMTTKSRSA